MCACGRAGVRACGRVGVWACGRAGVRVRGCVSVYMCSYEMPIRFMINTLPSLLVT